MLAKEMNITMCMAESDSCRMSVRIILVMNLTDYTDEVGITHNMSYDEFRPHQ